MVSEDNANQEVNSQEQESTPSPGAILKARRESLGLSQQQIAEKLFLKANQINDLECDVIDEKSSVTFTKGYVRNYAKQLGLNSQEVIAAFERFHNQTSVPSSTKLQSFSKRVAKQTHDDRWMMVTYIILLLIVAGVVVWWYQQPNDDDETSSLSLPKAVKQEASNTPIESSSNESNAASQNGSIQINDVELGGSEEEGNLRSEAIEPDGRELEETEQSSGTMASNSSNTAQAGSLDDTTSAIPSPPSDVDDSNNLTELLTDNEPETDALVVNDINNAAPISMTFTFDEDCWVNIKDATNEDIAYGVKQKGRVMEIQGIPPVEVTLGAPDNVRISVNGEPVDISSYQNGRTARFTLPM
ncbi:MAG: hypothetical protein AXW14_13565 [Alteromonas sp. Nap_26]|nr:MAG: hypothetical protein AXW14_13565 [Alteromonas sp. Nap_26]